jgi:hypothetical protein
VFCELKRVENLGHHKQPTDTNPAKETTTSPAAPQGSKPVLLPLKRRPQPNQLPLLNPQILRRDNIRLVRCRPIALRFGNVQSKGHLISELFAPNALVLRLRDLQVRGAAAGDVDPSLQVVLVWALLGEDESDLGGRGDFGVRQDGGDEDACVEVGVAGVEDISGGGGGLGPDVGALAAGLWCWLLV